MTDLTDRITEVLRRHVSAQTENWETKLRCECGGDFTSKLEYAAHVAEQITEALQPELAAGLHTCTFDDFGPHSECKQCRAEQP